MAINVTVRDIESFPGGTPKTITLDIAQVVPVGGSPEGDEIWVTSAATTATASGGASIQSIFKTNLKRGWARSSGLVTGPFTVPSSAKFKVSIDEAIGNGIDITLDEGSPLLGEDIAEDIETKIRAQALIGQGGAKAGNLSYLNCQVRFAAGRFSIESGTISDSYTGTGRSSVAIGAPSTGTDIRATLGLDNVLTSETLASRQITEASLAANYTTGDTIQVSSTAGFSPGDAILVASGTTSQTVVISGAGTGSGLSASQIRFVTQSGNNNLAASYPIGSLVRKLQQVDIADPVSAITTIDSLYRFSIDSIVNQIHFG